MTFDLRSDFTLVLVTADGDHTLLAPDETPTCRLYGEGGHVAELEVASFGEADITDVDPNGSGGSRLSAAGHPFQVGDVVDISGVGGSVNANGLHVVTAIADATFDIAVAPGGAYTAGGAASIRGMYKAAADAGVRAGLEPGRAYTAVWRYAVADSDAVQTQTFTGV